MNVFFWSQSFQSFNIEKPSQATHVPEDLPKRVQTITLHLIYIESEESRHIPYKSTVQMPRQGIII